MNFVLIKIFTFEYQVTKLKNHLFSKDTHQEMIHLGNHKVIYS